MGTERSDVMYGYWRDASDKFDYFVVGGAGALAAYVGQNLQVTSLGWNAATVELGALILLVGAVIFGFKRIENNVEVFKAMHKRLYAEEARGSLVEAASKGPSVNAATGDVLAPHVMRALAEQHDAQRIALRKVLEDRVKQSGAFYIWRNRLLLNGFALLVFARVIKAYIG